MKGSSFASPSAQEAYVEHVRTCKGHHDPRGPKFSRCPAMDPDWFTEDADVAV